jgi:hypothetical protein
MCQRVGRRPAIAHQPPGELLDRFQIVVIRLGAPPVTAKLAQELQHPTGRNVADQLPLTVVDDLLGLAHRRMHLLRREAFVPQVLSELSQMLGQRPFPLFLGGIDQARLLAFHLADDLVEHRLGNALIGCQWQAPDGA